MLRRLLALFADMMMGSMKLLGPYNLQGCCSMRRILILNVNEG